MVAKLLSLILVVGCLPWIYGVALMHDPCKSNTVDIDGQAHSLQHVQCDVQEFMESSRSLVICPIALAIIVVAKLISDRNKRLVALRSYCQTQVVCYLSQFMQDMQHQPYSARAIPYTLVQAMFVALMVEFTVVSVIMGSNVHVSNLTHLRLGFDPIAMVIGWALARIGVSIADVWLRPSHLLIQMIEAELSLAVDVLFMRRLFSTHKTAFWATMHDLESLYKLDQLREDVKSGTLYRYGGDHREQKFEGEDQTERFAQLMTPIRRVYIPDHEYNLVVDVLTGHVSHGAVAEMPSITDGVKHADSIRRIL